MNIVVLGHMQLAHGGNKPVHIPKYVWYKKNVTPMPIGKRVLIGYIINQNIIPLYKTNFRKTFRNNKVI